MAHVTGNNTWQDWPNTSTIISAGALENIEGQLDRQPDDLGCAYFMTSASQTISGNTQVPLATSTSSTVHVTNTSATVKTIATTGLWSLAGGVEFGTNTAAITVVWIGATTATGRRYVSQYLPSSALASSSVAIDLPLTSGTQLSLWAYSSVANSTSTAYSSGNTFFTLTLLRRS